MGKRSFSIEDGGTKRGGVEGREGDHRMIYIQQLSSKKYFPMANVFHDWRKRRRRQKMYRSIMMCVLYRSISEEE
jgi:hypothetical protein